MCKDCNKCEKDTSNIPVGNYCYIIKEVLATDNSVVIKTAVCPYWGKGVHKEEQNNGHCSYLNRGDWQVCLGLLWDKIKECGINLK